MPNPRYRDTTGTRPNSEPRVMYPHMPPSWYDQALCPQIDGDLFFPETGMHVSEARSICRRCPVQAECLAYALENNERHGIWGGLSDQERQRLRNRAA